MEWKTEWNGNFGMEYGRCQNDIEDFKNGMEDNLPYFHTNSIQDFAHGIYRKIYTDGKNKNMWKRLAAILATYQHSANSANMHHQIIEHVSYNLQLH